MLSIVIAANCATCDTARELAVYAREALPELKVEIVELDGEQTVPAGVVATPTYLLDGQVIYLGNPSPSQLIQKIMEHGNDAVGSTGKKGKD